MEILSSIRITALQFRKECRAPQIVRRDDDLTCRKNAYEIKIVSSTRLLIHTVCHSRTTPRPGALPLLKSFGFNLHWLVAA